MTINRKTAITSIVLGAVILSLVFFLVSAVFGQIQKESGNLIAKKKEVLMSEARIENIHNFIANFRQYQSNLKKIDELFVDASEPVEFIEFIEEEAAASKVSVTIAPSVSKKKSDIGWSALEFNLSVSGSFPDFSKFLERLESGPYLVEPANLSISRIADKNGAISAVLLIRAYAK